jgi:hypothetical protein
MKFVGNIMFRHMKFIVFSSSGSLLHAVAQLVEAQRCKPEGRGFDS